MQKIALLVLGLAATLTTSALADKPEPATKPIKETRPAQMTCADFIALTDVERPKLVYWAEGFNRKGKPEDVIFDVEAADRIVPVIVEVCKREPRESFLKKAKEEFKKNP